MRSKNRRTLLATFGLAPFAGGLEALAFDQETRPEAESPRQKDWSKVNRKSPREKIRDRMFPNVVLTTHEGKKVRFYDDLIKDKIVLLNFMYATCEGVCPGVTLNLAKVQKALGKRVGRDIFIYSITLRPEQDTPKVLKEYAEMHGAGPGWLFLTGSPYDIELIRRRQGFVDPDPELDKDKSNHAGNVRYGNEPRLLWAACPGLASPDFIVESVLWVDSKDSKETGKGGRK